MSRFFRHCLILLPILGLSASALAVDEPPLRAEEAFIYAVSDTGDAFEIDWVIEEGYYLYRDQLSFETADAAITLSNARLPAGETHTDEYFGEQQVYRDRFYVTVPYRVDGDRPTSIDLVIKSRGCADIGFCYAPQTWTETVKLRQKKEPEAKLQLGEVGSSQSLGGGMGDFPPPEEVFFPEFFVIDGNTVELSIRVIPEYYLYKSQIAVKSLSEQARVGRVELPKGKDKVDEWLGEQEVYYDGVLGRVTIQRATPEAMDLDLELRYQGCADAGLCYLPQTQVLSVSLPEATAVTDLSALPPDAPVSEQGRIAQIINNSPIWFVVSAMFGFGLLLAFTPCVLPMVPILTSIIAGEGDEVTPARGFWLAFSYVMGMAIVYTIAGIIAVAAGTQVQAAFNQPWVLSLFAGLFVILAIAMFGAFDLQMPSSIQSRLAAVSSNQKSGTVVGAFVMGALSSLIVTACVAPALIGALAVMAQSGDFFRGGVALFAMSWGMGFPLLIVAADNP